MIVRCCTYPYSVQQGVSCRRPARLPTALLCAVSGVLHAISKCCLCCGVATIMLVAVLHKHEELYHSLQYVIYAVAAATPLPTAYKDTVLY
jgi:hypothetical protein